MLRRVIGWAGLVAMMAACAVKTDSIAEDLPDGGVGLERPGGESVFDTLEDYAGCDVDLACTSGCDEDLDCPPPGGSPADAGAGPVTPGDELREVFAGDEIPDLALAAFGERFWDLGEVAAEMVIGAEIVRGDLTLALYDDDDALIARSTTQPAVRLAPLDRPIGAKLRVIAGEDGCEFTLRRLWRR